MLRRFAAVSAIALSLSIPAQAALANVQPIDRCPLKPHECVQTTLPEAIAVQDDEQPSDPLYRGSGRLDKQYQPYIPPHEDGPTSTQGTGTRYR
jgi:hypothetical protein